MATRFLPPVPEGWVREVVDMDKEIYGHKSGDILTNSEVLAGRLRELGLMNEHHMYDEVPITEAKGKID